MDPELDIHVDNVAQYFHKTHPVFNITGAGNVQQDFRTVSQVVDVYRNAVYSTSKDESTQPF